MSADQSSFGPALVGNISVDSLDNDSSTAAATAAVQLPEQGQIALEDQNLNQNLEPQEDLLQLQPEVEPKSEAILEPEKLDFEAELESAERKHDEPQAREEPQPAQEQLLLETEILQPEPSEHQEQPPSPGESQQQTQRDSPRIGNLLDLTFDAASSPVATQAAEAHHTGGDYSSFEHDAAYVTVGPTIREAEEYADQMTSEILEQASSSSSYESRPAVAASPPDLSAVKNTLISTYSNVAHIFHWTRPIESGIVFAIGLMLIAALSFFSIISVVAYAALGCILTSGVIRIYKTSMKALNRSPETPLDHIWDRILSKDVSMSPEQLHGLVDSSHAHLNASLVYLKQVLLVEDKIATTKIFLFLYSLTYIGSWFNGLTLITIIYLALFSVPKLYESNKSKIDEYLGLATKQLTTVIDSVAGKFGGSSKKQN